MRGCTPRHPRQGFVELVGRKSNAGGHEMYLAKIRLSDQRVCGFIITQAVVNDTPRAESRFMSSVVVNLSHGSFQADGLPDQNMPHHHPNFSTSTLTSRPSRNKEEQTFLTARFIPSGPETTTPVLPRLDAWSSRSLTHSPMMFAMSGWP